MRLSVCFDADLHVIEPCGFPFSAKAVKRAAMDYAAEARVIGHTSWAAFMDAKGAGRLILLTTRADTPYWSHDWKEDDFLLLGRESAGAPDYVHEAADDRVTIPMPGGGRSLNVVVAAGIVAAEASRGR